MVPVQTIVQLSYSLAPICHLAAIYSALATRVERGYRQVGMDCGASTAIRLYIHYFWADVGGAASWTFAAARFRFLRALSRALCFAEHDADRRAEGCRLPGAALAAAALLSTFLCLAWPVSFKLRFFDLETFWNSSRRGFVVGHGVLDT